MNLVNIQQTCSIDMKLVLENKISALICRKPLLAFCNNVQASSSFCLFKQLLVNMLATNGNKRSNKRSTRCRQFFAQRRKNPGSWPACHVFSKKFDHVATSTRSGLTGRNGPGRKLLWTPFYMAVQIYLKYSARLPWIRHQGRAPVTRKKLSVVPPPSPSLCRMYSAIALMLWTEGQDRVLLWTAVLLSAIRKFHPPGTAFTIRMDWLRRPLWRSRTRKSGQSKKSLITKLEKEKNDLDCQLNIETDKISFMII